MGPRQTSCTATGSKHQHTTTLLANWAWALTDTCTESSFTDYLITAEEAIQGHALGLARDRTPRKPGARALTRLPRPTMNFVQIPGTCRISCKRKRAISQQLAQERPRNGVKVSTKGERQAAAEAWWIPAVSTTIASVSATKGRIQREEAYAWSNKASTTGAGSGHLQKLQRPEGL